jgi:hypothetical protein
LALSPTPVDLDACTNLAIAGGFRSFLFTDTQSAEYKSASGGEDAAASANCFTHETDGKVAAFDPQTFAPIDGTCKFVPAYGEKQPEKYAGWFKQEVASGNGKVTDHWAVLGSVSECPKSWDETYRESILQASFEPAKYFKGVKVTASKA